jgi:hypothetical protein
MRMNFNDYSAELRNHFSAEDYANFNQLCIDAARKEVKGYSFEEANAEINKRIREIFELPEHPTQRQIDRAFQNPVKRLAAFEILEDTIEETLVSGWGQSPFFNTMVEIKNNRLGQKNMFYIPSDTLVTISRVNAGHHDMPRQRLGEGTERGIETSSIGAKIYMSYSRYLQGVEDWSALVNKISQALTRYVNTMMHTAFVAAGQSLPEDKWYIKGELNTANHDQFIKLIADVELATGSTAMIVGTKVALSQLKNLGDIEWRSEEAKNDVYHTGRIGTLEGTTLVELPQAFELNSTSAYLEEDNQLYIFPQNMDKPVKFFWEGDTQISQVTDKDTHVDRSMDYELTATCGCEVITGKRFGTWVIGA